MRPSPHALPHPSPYPFATLFTFPSAGAVDKLVLPDGMQSVDFSYCEVTGTAGG